MNIHHSYQHPASPKQVGVREFRTNLTAYLEGGESLEIVNKGRTLGYFRPAPKAPSKEALERMRKLLDETSAIAREAGITEDDIDAAFKAMRNENKA